MWQVDLKIKGVDGEMFKHTIGSRSNIVKNYVDKMKVKRFAEAIGDLNPIYYDETTGKNSRYKCNIAPPTFARTLDYGEIGTLTLPTKGLIHGEQAYHYERPLFVGEYIFCYTEVKDYKERLGSQGKMGILNLMNNGEDENGIMIFSSTIVIILNETVLKGLESEK